MKEKLQLGRFDLCLNVKDVKKSVEFYKKLDKSIPEDEKWKIMKQDVMYGGAMGELIPPETKNPLQILNKNRDETKSRLEYARQSSSAQEQQAMDTYETRQKLITPIKRLEQHGARMYAEAGLHAMQKTMDPNNPITVAIENLFPER